MYRVDDGVNMSIELEEVGYIVRQMLVAGDISLDGTKILLRRAKSEGKKLFLGNANCLRNTVFFT